jgi:hypothetical protein
METGPACRIKNRFLVSCAQDINEELPFAFCPRFPVDQLVSFFNEAHDVFGAILVGVANRERIVPVFLFS